MCVYRPTYVYLNVHYMLLYFKHYVIIVRSVPFVVPNSTEALSHIKPVSVRTSHNSPILRDTIKGTLHIAMPMPWNTQMVAYDIVL